MSVLTRNVVLKLLSKRANKPFVPETKYYFASFDSFKERRGNGSNAYSVLCMTAGHLVYRTCEDLKKLKSDLENSLDDDHNLYLFLFLREVTFADVTKVFGQSYDVARMSLDFIRECKQSLTDQELVGLLERCVIGSLDLFLVTICKCGRGGLKQQLNNAVRKLRQKFDYHLVVAVAANLPKSTDLQLVFSDLCSTEDECFSPEYLKGLSHEQELSKGTEVSEGFDFLTSLFARVCEGLPNAGTVIFATTKSASVVSCLKKDVPPFHSMCKKLSPDFIKCSGSCSDSDFTSSVLNCLDNSRRACLIPNCGLIAIGENLEKAMENCEIMEQVCEWYLKYLAVSEFNRSMCSSKLSSRSAPFELSDVSFPQQEIEEIKDLLAIEPKKYANRNEAFGSENLSSISQDLNSVDGDMSLRQILNSDVSNFGSLTLPKAVSDSAFGACQATGNIQEGAKSSENTAVIGLPVPKVTKKKKGIDKRTFDHVYSNTFKKSKISV